MKNEPAGMLKTAADEAASGRTEAEARIRKARNDRAGWFAASHASGGFGILGRDGREVARFDLEADRDAVLALVRLEAPAGAAVTALAFEQETYVDAKEPDTYFWVRPSDAGQEWPRGRPQRLGWAEGPRLSNFIAHFTFPRTLG